MILANIILFYYWKRPQNKKYCEKCIMNLENKIKNLSNFNLGTVRKYVSIKVLLKKPYKIAQCILFLVLDSWARVPVCVAASRVTMLLTNWFMYLGETLAASSPRGRVHDSPRHGTFKTAYLMQRSSSFDLGVSYLCSFIFSQVTRFVMFSIYLYLIIFITCSHITYVIAANPSNYLLYKMFIISQILFYKWLLSLLDNY